MRAFLICLLFAFPAVAQTPPIDFEPACRGGEIYGMIVRTQRAGIFMVRWDPKICAGRDA